MSVSRHDTRKDVDGGWAWVVMVTSFSSQLLVSGLPNLTGVFHVYLLEAFGETATKTAWVGALFSGFACAAGPISSLVINATNCRCSAIIGGLVTFIGFGASAFATNLDIMFITYGFLGAFGISLAYIPSIVTLGYYFEKRRAIATGVAVTGAPLGMAIFPPIIHVLVNAYGWRGAFAIIGAIALNLCACGLLYRPTRFERIGGKGLKMEMREDAGSNVGENDDIDDDDALEIHRTTGRRRMVVRDDLKNNDTEVNDGVISIEHEALMKEENRANSIHVINEIYRDNDDNHKHYSHSPDEEDDSNNTPNLYANRQGELNRTNIMRSGIDCSPLLAHTATNGSVSSTKDEDRDDYTRTETNQSACEKGIQINGKYMQTDSDQNARYGRSHSTNSGADFYHRKELGNSLGVDCGDEDRISDIKNNTMSLEKHPGKSSKVQYRHALKVCMADFAILKNPAFLFMLLGVLLFSIGKAPVFMYLPGLALKMGSNKEEGTLLATSLGLGNTFVRILAGVAANARVGLDKGCLLIGSLCIDGFVCLVFRIFSRAMTGRIVFGILFGFYYGVYPTLVNSITSEMVGVHNLSLAFGLQILSMGVGTLVGPPIAAAIMEAVDDYEAAFTFAGICFLLGCASCMASFSWKKKFVEEDKSQPNASMALYCSSMEFDITQSLASLHTKRRYTGTDPESK